MEIISILNRKGGTGKTATAHALGTGLAKAKKKVLMIDLDSQLNLTWTANIQAKYTAYELLSTEESENNVIPIEEFIVKTDQGDYIAGSEKMALIDLEAQKRLTTTHTLNKILKALKDKYDFVIIDTPAQLGLVTLNSLDASDSVIIPVQADAYSIAGITQLLGVISEVKDSLRIRGLLLTRYSNRSILSRQMKDSLNDIAKQLGTKLYKTPIRECIAIKEAAASQCNIYDYAPSSNAAADYKDFVKEFLKQK